MLLTAITTVSLALPTGPAWERWMGPDCEHSRTALVLFIAAVLLHCGGTLVTLACLSALLPGQARANPAAAPAQR